MAEYTPQTAAETLVQISQTSDPWIPVGNFLDDWRRTPVEHRAALCATPLPPVGEEHRRWAAFLAASVDYLCRQDNLPAPLWTRNADYVLDEPWFLYPGWRLRAWQLFKTPVAFVDRNIFGGDRILSRV